MENDKRGHSISSIQKEGQIFPSLGWQVIDATRRLGEASRRDLTRETGLNWSTISTVAKDLKKKSFLLEKGRARRGKAGPDSEILSLNPDAGYFLGVQIEPGMVTTRLLDFTFSRDASFELPLSGSNLASLIQEIRPSVSKTLQNLQESGKFNRLMGIGFSMPGKPGKISVPDTGFDFLKTDDMVAQEYRDILIWTPIVVDQASRCSAQAEKEIGGRDNLPRIERNIAYIHLDKHVGKGTIINGNLYQGKSGYAGGPEHYTLDDREQTECKCGIESCPTLELSEPAMITRWNQANNNTRGYQLDEIGLLAELGDQAPQRFFDEYGVRLGYELSRDILLFNPELIIIGGKISKYYDLFNPSLRQALSERCGSYQLENLRFERSRLGEDSKAVGAAINAYQAAKAQIEL